MRHNGSETVALNGEESPTAQRGLPNARASSVSLGRGSTNDALSSSANAACWCESEEYYVALAFEQFRQAEIRPKRLYISSAGLIGLRGRE